MMIDVNDLMSKFYEENPEYAKVKKDNDEFDIYFNKIIRAEEQYKKDNDISKLISFWEILWNSEGVHDVSYVHAFRLTKLYIEIGDYCNALKALRYLDDTPYYKNNNHLYDSILKQITEKI